MPRQLDPEGAALLLAEMGRSGVQVLLGHQTSRITQTDLGLSLCFRKHASITGDFVVVSAGIAPRGELAVDAGLSCTSRNAIIVNDRLQTSDPKIYAIGEYGKLFELDPDIKLLFAQTEMQEQKKKLMQMINVAVHGLHRLEDIVPAVQELGRGHVRYGVQDEHYDTVGAALLWTLEQGLGEDFTPEVKDAWAAAYTVLADTMKAAAADISVG